MRQVKIAGTELNHFHIAAFFDSREQEYEVLRDYIRDGVLQGEKTMHICDPKLKDDHVLRLREMGIDTAECARLGQLEVLTWYEAYLKDGKFDTETMLAMVSEAVKTAQSQGFEHVRLMGHMEWALEARPGVDEFLEYETRVTEVLNRLRQPAICVYDLSKFSGSAMVEIMRVHPYVVMGGVLRENPFFMPPRIEQASA